MIYYKDKIVYSFKYLWYRNIFSMFKFNIFFLLNLKLFSTLTK